MNADERGLKTNTYILRIRVHLYSSVAEKPFSATSLSQSLSTNNRAISPGPLPDGRGSESGAEPRPLGGGCYGYFVTGHKERRGRACPARRGLGKSTCSRHWCLFFLRLDFLFGGLQRLRQGSEADRRHRIGADAAWLRLLRRPPFT